MLDKLIINWTWAVKTGYLNKAMFAPNLIVLSLYFQQGVVFSSKLCSRRPRWAPLEYAFSSKIRMGALWSVKHGVS
jgi:hypothetical protein